MNNNNIERRYFKGLNIRSLDPSIISREIEGTAIVFNSESEYMGFIEVIEPEAITEEILRNSDIVMLYNHNQESGVLARSKQGEGTLSYSLDNQGVKFSFEAPNTSLGNDVYESLKRGDLDSCSFAFTIAHEGERIERNEKGVIYRYITKIERLYDFSIVVNPAYSATEVNARSLEKIKALQTPSISEEVKNSIEKQKRYIKNLKAKYL